MAQRAAVGPAAPAPGTCSQVGRAVAQRCVGGRRQAQAVADVSLARLPYQGRAPRSAWLPLHGCPHRQRAAGKNHVHSDVET